MERELLLAGGAAAVLGALLVIAAAVPATVARPADDVRPSRLDIRETTVAATVVEGETVTFELTTYLRHSGGPAENVTVVYRAVDLDTGLVATTVERSAGDITETGERSVTGEVTLERRGGYRLETVVYAGDERIAVGRTEVRGVGGLTPAYARSTVRFHEFGAALPAVEYTVSEVEGNRTTLNISAYLTNAGNDPARGLRLVVKARQADSNIVAAESSVRVGDVGPGRTVTPSAELVVPSGYNYYLDAVLWKDGVIVGTARSAANLDPTETLSVNETRRAVDLRVEDFERDRTAGAETPTPAATGTAEPGFGIAAALAALAGAALLARRWSA